MVVNKWDAIEKDTHTMDTFRKKIISDLKFMSYAPVLFLSALTGQRVNTVLAAVKEAYAQYTKRIPTGVINEALADAQAKGYAEKWLRCGKKVTLVGAALDAGMRNLSDRQIEVESEPQ